MRTRNRRKAALFLALLVGACAVWACGSSEEENEGSGATNDAQKFFVEKVNSSIDSACAECHKSGKSGAPVFLGTSALASYTAIEGFPGLISAPSFSPLIQKGPHSGPALTQTQSDLVTQWLKLEVTQRKLNADPGTPKNLRAAFKAFGQCMDYNRWLELKLDTIGATTTENNQGTCISCHNTGQASLWWSTDKDETFLKMREYPYIQRLIVGRVNKEGLFDGLEGARRIAQKGTEAQQPQSNSHPRYNISSELATGIDLYVQETLSNLAANRCQNVTVPEAGPDAEK
ncbi:MAG: hypothetical protein JST00_41360 [Deltaproteobacteria bacterium]|nr:hypothetical protein [Deltaproteobacteria bacterium]